MDLGTLVSRGRRCRMNNVLPMTAANQRTRAARRIGIPIIGTGNKYTLRQDADINLALRCTEALNPDGTRRGLEPDLRSLFRACVQIRELSEHPNYRWDQVWSPTLGVIHADTIPLALMTHPHITVAWLSPALVLGQQ